MNLIPCLFPELQKELKTADEIWVAVGLLNRYGLNKILENSNCRYNFLVGVDLPSDPEALKILFKLQKNGGSNVKVFTEKPFFHPKLYLIKEKNNYKAFLGSANCTSGGLCENIELSVKITENKICHELLNWFKENYDVSKPLTSNFIKKYQKEYLKRKERKNTEEKTAKKQKEELKNENFKILKRRNDLIEKLKKYKTKKDYPLIVKEREDTIVEIKKALDYPHFNNLNIESFFSIYELGHLIPISKPVIYRNLVELKRLLIWLCNEKVDISQRYQQALKGDLKVDGVNNAFVSKVLNAHHPHLYFVKNQKSEKALRKYGITLPRGLSEGEKYKRISILLKEICEETGINDLSVLDYYLYLEGNK